ncbi:chord-domain-containing protein [Obba rivulosa]|uniref:Chord-domain-containing protein n=1 Tax=Obba rivulosa TaxID=1052685 RepID=A0A8E2ATS3_9APHY|nr:chord-domain-containing protein [Obba rivulosa]
MLRCTNRGCGQEFDAASNSEDSCAYHPGAPVFHEGLKSWSCCSGVNKPVLDFDEFMKIPGCTSGLHSEKAPVVDPAPKPTPSVGLQSVEVKTSVSQPGQETYRIAPRAPSPGTPPEPAPVIEEEDDLSAPVAVGTECKRNGCKTKYESDEASRVGDGPGTVCKYHPMPPIFREGSKGYLCCKRRVLEFEEFLKIEGCKTGRHVFVPKNQAPTSEQFTECRIDHYQTPSEVHVSVFAKQVDKERSTVKIEPTHLHLELYLPGNKRFSKSIELFGPIDPASSSHKYYGTKVELVLKKSDTRSWTLLEKTNRDLGGINLTFGVSGRTGTIGAKEAVLDASNKIKG